MVLPTDVAFAAWMADEELDRQRNIVLARNYYDGLHDVRLTERQKEFLGYKTSEGWRFCLNYCNIVVDSVVGRLLLHGVKSSQGNETLDEWARNMLKLNRLDAIQMGVHRGAVRDAEHFLVVDWDKEARRPRLSPHPRYTDGQEEVGGSGYGCKAHYPENDPTLPMLYASKRWTEQRDVNGTNKAVRRMNLYYPDHLEEYALDSRAYESSWEPIGPAKPWVDRAGRPLGIPVFHYRNSSGSSELWDAVPIQDAINKTALDILAMADTNAWGFLVAKGFTPTTDGKDPASDGSNLIKVHPGMWLGPLPADGDIERLAGEDMGPLLAVLDSLIFKLAQVTDTPISRFQVGLQVRAEGTLQQQEEPLLAKVRECQVVFGNAWEDAVLMALRLQNTWGEAVAAPDDVRFESDWEPGETRDQMADELAFWTAAEQAGKAGVPLTAFLELQGWDEAKINKIANSPEHQAKLAMQQAAVANFGGEQQAQNG